LIFLQKCITINIIYFTYYNMSFPTNTNAMTLGPRYLAPANPSLHEIDYPEQLKMPAWPSLRLTVRAPVSQQQPTQQPTTTRDPRLAPHFQTTSNQGMPAALGTAAFANPSQPQMSVQQRHPGLPPLPPSRHKLARPTRSLTQASIAMPPNRQGNPMRTVFQPSLAPSAPSSPPTQNHPASLRLAANSRLSARAASVQPRPTLFYLPQPSDPLSGPDHFLNQALDNIADGTLRQASENQSPSRASSRQAMVEDADAEMTDVDSSPQPTPEELAFKRMLANDPIMRQFAHEGRKLETLLALREHHPHAPLARLLNAQHTVGTQKRTREERRIARLDRPAQTPPASQAPAPAPQMPY
jgi:hypothetical protein